MNMTVGVQMRDLRAAKCMLMEDTLALVIGNRMVVHSVTAEGMQEWIDKLIDVHAKLQRIEAEVAA
jgi:hypothetical protein